MSVIAVTIPAMIIVVSYSTIWFYMWKNHQYLKQQGTTCTKNLLNRSESRTAWTVTIVVSCYFLFVLPQPIKDIILNYLDEKSTSGLYLDKVTLCLYWLQFSLNFFIYAVRNSQYRQAYKYFLSKVNNCIMNTQL